MAWPVASASATGRPVDGRKPGEGAAVTKVRSNPPAPRMAIVSLAEQHIEVFEADGRVVQSRVSTGKAGHGTPSGVFSVLQRNRYHESNLYSNAPMPFMQRLTWSGIALHEGYVPGYRASHGCIRMPPGFASSLWKVGYIGMRVIVSPHRVRPHGFSHPALPEPVTTTLPQLAALVRVAATADDIAAPAPDALSPYEAAQHRLALAAAAKAAADKAVGPALENAAAKSREANQASAALRASAGILADAEEHLELENLAMATVQTESAEAAIVTRIRFAAAGVEAARTSHAKLKQIEEAASDGAFAAARAAREAQLAAEHATEELNLARKAVSPITLFVSRATQQLYVRQGFHDLYDAPVAIRDPDRPLGTHVFTATQEVGASGMRWTAVTLPTSATAPASRDRATGQPASSSAAAAALDRIELPDEVRRLMGERLWPGASIIVSDYGLGETNVGTDFVIVTK